MRVCATILLVGWSVLAAGCMENRMRMAERVKAEMEPFFDHAEHDPEEVRGEIVSAADFLGMPRAVEVVGDYVVVSDMVSEHVIHVFLRGSHEHVASFGRRGQGPTEFASFAVLSDIPGADDLVMALDPSFRRVTRFRLPEGDVVRFAEREVVPTMELVYALKMIDESRAVGLGFFENGRLGLFDFASQSAAYAGPVPGRGSEASFLIRQQAYHGHLALDPARTRAAVALRLGTDIDIYTGSGRHLARARTPYRFSVDYQVDEDGNFMAGAYNRHGYQSVAASDSLVYALFSGRAEIHFMGMRGLHGEFVHVFDWEGNLTRVIRLDQAVLAIALDGTGSKLYGVTERPRPAVLVFSVM